MKADILREKFLDFFKSKRHKIVESDSLIPQDDPTVLFTPAGMNQFKKQFFGFIPGFTRAATSQRCLRTDDLDKVGKTPAHHTFFEMLGNFSFGDYFKDEAIAFAWEFLTEELKIKKERLWVSIYKDDDESYKIWKDKIKVPKDKIIKLGDKENFWPSEAKEKGPNGPCGPCSEIFFDMGTDFGCKKPDCKPACDCGRFIEIWNLVFTQFNRKGNGALEPLPKKNIDTGMGLERLAAVMQGVCTNFETDLFQPIVKEIVSGLKSQASSNKELIYAVADHIRAITFAIYDGVLPSNEARGYVVKKLIRKSCLNLRTLGIEKPFLYKLVPLVAEIMKAPYPDLVSRRENISGIVLAEEENFISTLNTSGFLLKDKFSLFLKKPDPEKVGAIAFQLYDTYGIPFDLTKDWLDEHSIKISYGSFNKELEKQKVRSKLHTKMKGDVFNIKDSALDVKETKFLGYKEYETQGKVLKIIKAGKEIKKISKNGTAEIILDKTCFYPESGGQVGDTGQIVKGKNIFEIIDTKKNGKVIIHIGTVKEGSFKKSDNVSARIDPGRRLAIARNHTATHLLQSALRKILGEQVQQQGSLVADNRLRFDFTHFKGINKQELNRIEGLVNNYIMNNAGLMSKKMKLQDAKKKGALAFFKDKYEGMVRVVSVGDFSQELCGGTHLESTGGIGLFKIIQEGSIASGIRRIEAVTGEVAYGIIKKEESVIDDISSILGVPLEKIKQETEKRILRIKELEKHVNAQKIEDVKVSVDQLLAKAEIVNGIKIISEVKEGLSIDLLRKTIDLIKEKAGNSVIALGSKLQGRALLVMGITEDLCSKGLDASKLITDVASEIGGSGGGRKDFAQAGGNRPENFDAAFQKLKNIIGGLEK
jgi:alanyl-tRNA synthetase